MNLGLNLNLNLNSNAARLDTNHVMTMKNLVMHTSFEMFAANVYSLLNDHLMLKELMQSVLTMNENT
jgi:hypothetical protein